MFLHTVCALPRVASCFIKMCDETVNADIKEEVKTEDYDGSVVDSTQYYISPAQDPLALLQNDPGIYDFSVYLGPHATPKNRWTYSKTLGKLFIVWNQVIPLEFKWSPEEPDLRVRAVPMYIDPQHMKIPVLRCRIHTDVHDPTNEGFPHVHHVIRSDNPGVEYDTDELSGVASVVVPLGQLQPGTGTVTVTYRFLCKSSCTTGMMRRPIVVLLNLERPDGEVIGRQSLNVKVCSCPRRDMEKEEDTMRLKTAKKRRKEAKKYGFEFEVNFRDKETFSKILEFNHGIATSLLRTSHSHSQRELDEFLRVIEAKLQVLA